MKYLFVTGKLAEPALRRVLAELAPQVGFDYEVAVLNISVAALMTPAWVARHLPAVPAVDRVFLPGFCEGDLSAVEKQAGASAQRGPRDLRDLPEHFGHQARPDYGPYDIEIIAEINHAPRLPLDEILRQAADYHASGADVIDIGCDPGATWSQVGECVKALRDRGLRVSVDSFNVKEVETAVKAGTELVLSVNSSNVEAARDWGCEVVAVPDVPANLEGLDAVVERLSAWGVKHRLDPVLEPIGFGFAASLGRYIEVRRRYPATEIMMGVGNLTELTDVDSAGVNVVLAGFCQELAIRSVLTTEVINWARSSVRELDLARRLVHYAFRNQVPPKHVEPGLIVLRDEKLKEHGAAGLEELAKGITDRNYRLFAEGDLIHVINGAMHLTGSDAFALFEEMRQKDPTLAGDPAHAFYLGHEMHKAHLAIQLGKNYVQDRPLAWGHLSQKRAPARENQPILLSASKAIDEKPTRKIQ